MKRKLLTLLLLSLIGLAGNNAKVMAQTPEPSAQWTFSNPDDLMAASKGSLKMIPAVMGAKSISFKTVAEAGLKVSEGPAEGNNAILVPKASALKVERAEGAEATQSYSLMMDIMMPDANSWNGLFQTDEANSNDGDLFTHDHQIGIASIGGYFGSIKDGKWYRVVLTYRDGKNILYVNGEKLVASNPDANDRFKIQPFGFYLFCDESFETVDTYVAEVAFWETPLTDEQVSEMGGVISPAEAETVTIASVEDLNNFAQLVENGTEVNGVLTADINLSESEYPNLMIGTEANPFKGTFDGQGHTITYNYEEVTDKWRGLFAFVDGGTIRNLRVEGNAYVTNIHFGALIGRGDGNILVENVVTNVDITGMSTTGVQGDAGMIGANYANITFNNCATLGPMGSEISSMYSSYSGWSHGNSKTTLNNCYSACEFKEGTGIDSNSGTLTHGSGTNTFNNCYYLNYIDKKQGTQITAEQIANGALCYKLNGNQTDIVWTQDIDTDPYPMPDPRGKRVYASGVVRCDGAELEDNPLTYSNTESYPTKPAHQFDADGICIVCGQADPDAVKKNAEGYYLIGNAKQLNWLNQKVLEGDADIKALLTDDINLTEYENPDLMIGSSDKQFKGIFDGGGHTITYSYVVTENYGGLFAYMDGATIRNLRIEGEAVVTAIHFGALNGRMQGDVLIENVVTNVNITGERSGVTGDGGMTGALYGNVTFNNCATLGEMGNPGSSMYCGFVAYAADGTLSVLNNCYTACSLVEGTGTDYCYTFCRGDNKLNNCHYLNAVGAVQGIPYEEEELASGALCYRLNGDQSEINWYQNLGEDEIPVPDKSHYRVYGAGQTFVNITDDASFKAFVSMVIAEETERYEGIIAQKSLVESYLEALEGLRSSANIDAFLAGYAELDGLRQSVNSCAEAYAAYIAKVEDVKQYLEEHPDLDNEKAEELKSYLTEYNDPTEDYPHGSAPAILEECELSEEEIIAETALIDERLIEALTVAPSVGTDVTMLFINPDLRDKFNGWEGKLPTGWGTSETSPLYAAECLATTMDMYQTVTGVKNGIYELRINGAFRPTPHTDYYNTNYAATLYANGVYNYFQTNIEDMISVNDAIDGENCNITGPIADFAVPDDNGETIGYTMQGIVSCCNAFQAGRYPNSILCNVTDGTLTIGVRQPGTGLSRDWLGFGNIKVVYYGDMADAQESLDHVLESQSARATTILDTYKFDYAEYATYPNFSQALKDDLRETLNAVATTTEPEAKYKLIEKFSELFLQICDCKKAYVTLMEKAEQVNMLQDAFSDILSDEEYEQMDELYTKLVDAYVYGTMTAEEALAINLKEEISFYPDEEDGYFLLHNLKDYIVFANLVNAGNTQVNAKLLADIDLRESETPNLMIGTSDAQFSGTFDGQGHTVSYSYEVNDNYCGLFRYVDGGTIRNLRVEGDATVTTIHFGALVGWASNTVLIESVITDVDITGVHSGVTGDGGMFGRLEGNATFNNCATLGAMGNEGSSMYCGFVAYSGSGSSTLNNCYTACTLTEGTGTDYCYTFYRGNGNLNNCYYLNAIGEAQGKQMSLEQFKSGEVCFKLNGDQSQINWFQNIGADEFPVLDDTHQVVFKNEDGSYENRLDPDGIENVNVNVNDNIIYNLSGQRISRLQKGINIINGKKVLY
ncbi:MAG: hypothetical protein IJR69_11490 [Bacteroidaceae bacterium]|nr:hypothetical protein [Bacteroidaceae bacterium]